MPQTEIRNLADRAGSAPIEFGATQGRGVTIPAAAVKPATGVISLSEGWWEVVAVNGAATLLCVLFAQAPAADPLHATLLPAGAWPTSLTSNLIPFAGPERIRFYLPAEIPDVFLAHSGGGDVVFALRKVFTR